MNIAAKCTGCGDETTEFFYHPSVVGQVCRKCYDWIVGKEQAEDDAAFRQSVGNNNDLQKDRKQ